MASNLVSYLMQSLTPDVVARLAAALGLETDKVQRGVGAAVPALLAALAGVIAQPGGAEKVADVAKQQGGVAGDPGAMLSASGQSSLAQSGSQLLSSLLGGNTSALSNAIGSYSGLGQNAGGSLLSMLAPLVMCGIARRMGGDLSANGIANLFTGERDNIMAAMPAGMRDALGGTGLLQGLGGSARAAATAGSDTVARTAAPASSARDTTATTPSTARSSNWLYWLIGALALLAILYYLFGRPTERVEEPTAPPATETPAPAEPQAPAPAEPQSQAPSGTQPAAPAETQTQTAPAAPTPAAPSLMVAGVDVGKQASDAVANIETALGGVTDAASAQAAVSKVQAQSDALDKVSGVLGQLSAEQKTALSDMVKPKLASLNALFDRILALPGVSDVLKPTIDGLRTKLAALAP
jgi:hypothetical protein